MSITKLADIMDNHYLAESLTVKVPPLPMSIIAPGRTFRLLHTAAPVIEGLFGVPLGIQGVMVSSGIPLLQFEAVCQSALVVPNQVLYNDTLTALGVGGDWS